MTAPFLTIKDVPIYFSEDWDTGIGGGLWSTGLAMAKYFESQADQVRQECQKIGGRNTKAKVMELGSGNGFLSVCFLALAQDIIDELVVTDLEDHLELMQKTFDANPHLTLDRVRVQEYKWGDEQQQEYNKDNDGGSVSPSPSTLQAFDLIFGTDVAYHESLYDVLITSFVRLSHPQTRILIGVTMNDTKPSFFHKLRQAGFRYERLADHLMPAEFRGPLFGIFVIRRN